MKKNILDKTLKHYQSLTTSATDVRHFEHDQLAIISDEIGRVTPLDFARQVILLNAFAIYGSWQAILGILKLAENDTSGWQNIYSSYLYRAWKLRVEINCGDRLKKTKNRLLRDGFADTLAQAIVFGDDDYANWCANRVINSFNTREGAFTNDPHGTPIEPFIFKLFAIWRNQAFDCSRIPGCSLGVFQQLIDCWDVTDDRLANAFLAICEYHCDLKGYVKYANVPHLHIPFEILCAKIIRANLNMPTPEFNHPILQTQFTLLPDNFSVDHDQILNAAINKIRQANPEIGNPW